MANSDALKRLFPQDGEIPAEHRPPPPIHQRTYLVNGELKPWDGPVDTVRSPVCVRKADGRLEQIELGRCPPAESRRPRRPLRPRWPPTTTAAACGRL